MTTRSEFLPSTQSDKTSFELSAAIVTKDPSFWDKKDVDTRPQLGNTLCDRAEKIYHQTKTLRAFVQNTASNPMRTGCSIVSLVCGVTSLCSGDLITGAIATTAGAKELWNLTRTANPTDLQRLLNDINADVGMIQTLEEANRESYKTVDANLDLIKGGIEALQSQLSQIEQINDQGLKKIAEKKSEAASLNIQALQAYNAAAQLFEKAQDKLTQSQEHYGNCGAVFEQIAKIAKNESPDLTLEEKIEQLIETSSIASENCKSGKMLLDISAQHLHEALERLKDANAFKDQATALSSAVIQLAEDALQSGKEKAMYTQNCQQQIDAAKDEMKRIQARSNQIMKLIEELKEDVVEAKQEAAGKFSMSDVAVGVGIAATMVPAAGILYGAATGVSAMYAFRNSETLSSGAKKVYNWYYGIKEPQPVPMQPDELTRLQFNETSSGYWGWMRGRSSQTVGKIQINFGNESVSIPFNLNQRDRIAKEDLLDLFQMMNAKVSNGTLDPDRCVKILDQLETLDVGIHGNELGRPQTQWNGPANGLIRRSSAAYAIVTLLRETCANQSALKS